MMEHTTPVFKLFDLSGKVALITGGGRGIGKTIAEALAEAGAAVAITGRREEWLTPTVQEFEGRGFQCQAIVADVSIPEDVERTARTTLERFGQIDILVNNAGQTWHQATEDMPFAKWQQVLNTNLNGMFLMSQLVGRHMLSRQSGTILNIASVMAFTAGDGEAIKTIAYNTSKAGVVEFTRTIAMEWGRRGIRVNALAPGWFPTRMSTATIEANRSFFEEQTALGRVGDVSELKGAALFLVSPASSYITGQTVIIDGGITL